jgi:hypothetical protein
LTAILEGELDKLQDFSNSGAISVYETLGYKLGNLGFGLNAAEYLSQAANADLAVEIAPWVQYTLGNIVPRLDVVYFLGGTTPVTGGGHYGRLNGYANPPSYNADNTVLSFRPSVKFNAGSAFVELGDVVYLITTAAADSFWNVFYVDFKWSF